MGQSIGVTFDQLVCLIVCMFVCLLASGLVQVCDRWSTAVEGLSLAQCVYECLCVCVCVNMRQHVQRVRSGGSDAVAHLCAGVSVSQTEERRLRCGHLCGMEKGQWGRGGEWRDLSLGELYSGGVNARTKES